MNSLTFAVRFHNHWATIVLLGTLDKLGAWGLRAWFYAFQDIYHGQTFRNRREFKKALLETIEESKCFTNQRSLVTFVKPTGDILTIC